MLPQFSSPIFEQSGANLPASTQFLIDASEACFARWRLCSAGACRAAARARWLLGRPGPRLLADRFLLLLPVLGTLLQEVLAARFTRVLGTLLVNGVPLIAALSVVRDAVGNYAAVAAIDGATSSARGGYGLAQPLAEARIFPARTTHLLRLGEENARLGPGLAAATIDEERTRQAMQRPLALLVPAITVLMGLLVAGIVMSMMTAMLGLNGYLAAGSAAVLAAKRASAVALSRPCSLRFCCSQIDAIGIGLCTMAMRL